MALFAERYRNLFWNALADIYFTSQTSHTNIGRIWTNWDTTIAAQDVSRCTVDGFCHILHFSVYLNASGPDPEVPQNERTLNAQSEATTADSGMVTISREELEIPRAESSESQQRVGAEKGAGVASGGET